MESFEGHSLSQKIEGGVDHSESGVEQEISYSDIARVRFFVEEHPENLRGDERARALQTVLSPKACEFLAERKWGISLAMIELNRETAKVIWEVNKDFPDIPFSAWIVLPDAEGYWTTKFNVPSTRKRVEEFKAWADRFHLRIDTIGFDLEPPLAAAKALSALNVVETVHHILEMKRARREQEQAGYSPEAEMDDLLRQLRHEGIRTESYEMPGPFDKPMFGVLQSKDFDIRSTMVYTSGLPRIVQKYAPDLLLKSGTNPAVGVVSSTGQNPGRDFGGMPSLHGKEELTRDIIALAKKGARENRDVLKNLWVFALTDLKVASWTAEALERAQAYRLSTKKKNSI